VIGIVLSIVSSVVGVIAIVLAILTIHPRRLSTEPLPPSRLPRIRVWRSKSFRYGLYLIQQYEKAILTFDTMSSDQTSDQDYTLDDLRQWAYLVVLSCASCIVPDSQSKSTLYRFTSIGAIGQSQPTLGTFEFVGNIPLTRIVDNGSYKEIGDSAFSDSHGLLKVVAHGRPQLLRLDEGNLSENEQALGTTHILVMPIVRSIAGGEVGTVAALTVDLRMRWFRTRLYNNSWFLHRSQLIRRAERLQSTVRDLTAALVTRLWGQ
jgi:hypothetical protein